MPPAIRNADLDSFAAAVADHIDQIQLDPTEFSLVAAADDHDSILLLVIDDADRSGATADLDQLISSDRRVVAMALPTGWSPTAHGSSSPAWLLLVVAAELPVFAAVRRTRDDRWTQLAPDDLPWFALSTAAGLRAALVDGRPLRLKADPAPQLYERPGDVPRPPLDERGEL